MRSVDHILSEATTVHLPIVDLPNDQGVLHHVPVVIIHHVPHLCRNSKLGVVHVLAGSQVSPLGTTVSIQYMSMLSDTRQVKPYDLGFQSHKYYIFIFFVFLQKSVHAVSFSI